MLSPIIQVIMKTEDKKLLENCEVQTYKASGKGGQHVQKTNSAVRLIHLPSGIRVECQQERSQYLNKMICLEKLREKLAERAKRRKKRIPTKKSRGVKATERKEKERHSSKKQLRRPISGDDG